jgi:hypothetical protein
MFKIGARQAPIARQGAMDSYRYVPIEVVEKLRHDPAWTEVIMHLEQGRLGMGIKYPEVEVIKEEVKEVDQKIKEEVKELKAEVKELKAKVIEDICVIEAGVKNEVRKMEAGKVSDDVRELKAQVNDLKSKEVRKEVKQIYPKKARDPTITTIQVSKEFKKKLKILKGSKTYEELLKERTGI